MCRQSATLGLGKLIQGNFKYRGFYFKMLNTWEVPGGPVVRTWHFHYRGPRFNPWGRELRLCELKKKLNFLSLPPYCPASKMGWWKLGCHSTSLLQSLQQLLIRAFGITSILFSGLQSQSWSDSACLSDSSPICPLVCARPRQPSASYTSLCVHISGPLLGKLFPSVAEASGCSSRTACSTVRAL